MHKVLDRIPDGLDFVLGEPTFSKPDWATKHQFVPAVGMPEVCGYEADGIECRWPEDSKFHESDAA